MEEFSSDFELSNNFGMFEIKSQEEFSDGINITKDLLRPLNRKDESLSWQKD